MAVLKFANPELSYVLLIIPILIVLYLLLFRKQLVKNIKNIVEESLHTKVFLNFYRNQKLINFIFFISIITFLILALINPQIGTRLELVKRKGVDIIIALDVSKSMLSKDIAPSRIEKAKKEIRDLVNILQGDRIGIICFSGDAFVQVPLTIDYAAVNMFLSYINPGIIPRPGTAISKAVSLALSSFQDSADKYKVLILMTDGEDHEKDETLKIVEQAAERNIKIYTIGFGSPEGSLVPNLDQNENVLGYKKDKDGNYITSRLNDQLLREISGKTEADFYYASSNANELDFIYQQIQSMEKKKISEREFTQFEDRFQIFLLIAIGLIIIEIIFYEYNRRIKNG